MKIPLYGFVCGDTIGLLIMADSDETIQDLANKTQQAAKVRVAPKPEVDLIYQDQVIAPHLTVVQSGIQALDRFDVVSRPG